MRLDTEKHSKAYLRDTLVKLQAMQKCDNKALQICVQEPLLLHFYTAPAVHEDEAKRNPNGAWLEGKYALPAAFYFRLIRRQPSMRMKRSGIRMEHGWRENMHSQLLFILDLYGASRP